MAPMGLKWFSVHSDAVRLNGISKASHLFREGVAVDVLAASQIDMHLLHLRFVRVVLFKRQLLSFFRISAQQ